MSRATVASMKASLPRQVSQILRRCRLIAHPALLVVPLLICANILAQPAVGFNELGANYFKEGRYAEALERFERALQLAPNNPSVQKNIGLTHQALAREAFEHDDTAAALAHLEKAIAIDPKNPAPHVLIGGFQFGVGDLPAARSHLETALRLDPAQQKARVLLGEIHYRNNALAKAKKHWAQVLKEKPDWPGLQDKLDKLVREDSVESGFRDYVSEHFKVRYAKALSEEMRDRVFAILEEAYQEIGKTLGGIYPPHAVHVVLYDGNQFSEATQSKQHVGALFDGKIRAPITNKKGRFLSTATLTSRLRHEYVHVVLRYHVGNKVPWWLNEGLAETLSRDMDQNRLRILRKAYRTGNTFPFAELEANALQRLDSKQLHLAYAQVHVAVNTLWAASGNVKFQVLLQKLRADTSPEDALRQSLGLDYAELARRTIQACQ